MTGLDATVGPPGPRADAEREVAAWGNSAPLALAAFAVTTFMLSMVNSGIVNIAVLPVSPLASH